MAPPKLLSLVGSCFLFLHFSQAQGTDGATGTTGAEKSTPADCLNVFNGARTAAGLAGFKEKSFATGQTLSEICKRVQEGGGGYHEAATFFYAHQTGEQEDCAAAVTFWRSGITLVGKQLPPVYTESDAMYKNETLLGLVGLFNPKEDAGVQCQYVKCPVTPTTTSSTTTPPSTTATTSTSEGTTVSQRAAKAAVPTDESAGGSTPGTSRAALGAAAAQSSAAPSPSQPETGAQVSVASSSTLEKQRRLSAANTYNALVCITTPPALVKEQRPFSQDQWDKIVGAVSASSTATVSAFSLLALTAITIYIM